MGQTRPTLLYPTALSLGSQLKVELVKNKRIEISKQWVPPYNLRIFRCYSEHWTIFMGTNLEELKQVFEIFSNLLNSNLFCLWNIKTKEILYFEFLNKRPFWKMNVLLILTTVILKRNQHELKIRFLLNEVSYDHFHYFGFF